MAPAVEDDGADEDAVRRAEAVTAPTRETLERERREYRRLVQKYGADVAASVDARAGDGWPTSRDLAQRYERRVRAREAAATSGMPIKAKLELQIAYLDEARRTAEALEGARRDAGEALGRGGEGWTDVDASPRGKTFDAERFACEGRGGGAGAGAEAEAEAEALGRMLDAIEGEHGVRSSGGASSPPTRPWSSVGVRSNGERQVAAALGRAPAPRIESTYFKKTRAATMPTATTTKGSPTKQTTVGDAFALAANTALPAGGDGKDAEKDSPPSKRRASSRGKKEKADPIMVDLLESGEEEENPAENTFTLNTAPALVSNEGDEPRRSTRSSRYRSLQTELGNLSAMYPDENAKGAVQITLGDLENLKDGAMLNDQCVDFFLKYVQIETMGKQFPEVLETVHVFNSFFYQKLAQRHDDDSMDASTAAHARVKGWTKGLDIFSKEFLLIPVHSNLHWSLVIVCYPDAKEKQQSMILHLDSLTQGGGHNSELVSRIIRRYLNKEWRARGKGEEEERFSTKVMPAYRVNVPRQQNGCDCGVFILAFVEKFLTEKPPLLEKSQVILATQKRTFATNDSDSFLRKDWFPNEAVEELRTKLTALVIDHIASTLGDDDMSKLTLKEAYNSYIKELDYRHFLTSKAETKVEKDRVRRAEAKEEERRRKEAHTVDDGSADDAEKEDDKDKDFEIGLVKDPAPVAPNARPKRNQTTFAGSNWLQSKPHERATEEPKVKVFTGASHRLGRADPPKSASHTIQSLWSTTSPLTTNKAMLLERHNRSQQRVNEERLEIQEKTRQHIAEVKVESENKQSSGTLLSRLEAIRGRPKNRETDSPS